MRDKHLQPGNHRNITTLVHVLAASFSLALIRNHDAQFKPKNSTSTSLVYSAGKFSLSAKLQDFLYPGMWRTSTVRKHKYLIIFLSNYYIAQSLWLLFYIYMYKEMG